MGMSNWPPGATSREIRLIQDLDRAMRLPADPDVRKALADALEVVDGLIRDRGKRIAFEGEFDRPFDGG